jgi:hypothetical protein
MRLDEFQLAGQMPSNIQRAVPVTAQPSQPAVGSAGGNSLEDSLVKFVDKADDFPDDSPVHAYVNSVLKTILSYIPDITIRENSATNQSSLDDTNRSLLEDLFPYLSQLSEDSRNTLKDSIDGAILTLEQKQKLSGELYKIKGAKKAFTKQNVTIQLDTKGNIAKMDADIEATARQFAKDFKLPLKWARNLIGMFEVNITREQRKEFLIACRAGTALDVGKMINDGEGRVEDYVLLEQPELKEVYNSVKDTLLDISLSTGQRGATGPFEAMMAIMGGCKKPGINEGGDLKYKDLKLEVKATSISAVTESATAGKANSAWLDSTAGKEISGSTLRSVANDWLDNYATEARTNKAFQDSWKKADFRPAGLESLKQCLVDLRSVEGVPVAPAKKLIKYMMGTMFPSIVKLQNEGYDFDASCMRILTAIGKLDTSSIAKEQGVMALLEYITGKGNDGFVFFNPSTQKFKIVMGVKGVLEELKSKNGSNLHFDSTMTMGKSAKASPGIYYGAKPNSPEGIEYLKKFNSSPERVAQLKQIEADKAAARENKSLAMIQAAKEGESEFEFDGKMYAVSKAALKKYFEPDMPISRTKKKTR